MNLVDKFKLLTAGKIEADSYEFTGLFHGEINPEDYKSLFADVPFGSQIQTRFQSVIDATSDFGGGCWTPKDKDYSSEQVKEALEALINAYSEVCELAGEDEVVNRLHSVAVIKSTKHEIDRLLEDFTILNAEVYVTVSDWTRYNMKLESDILDALIEAFYGIATSHELKRFLSQDMYNCRSGLFDPCLDIWAMNCIYAITDEGIYYAIDNGTEGG